MKFEKQLDLNSELDRAGSRADALKKKMPKAEGKDSAAASETAPEISTAKKEPTKEDLYWRKVFPGTNNEERNDSAQERKDKIINNIAKPSEQNQKLPDQKLPENRVIRGKKNKWKDQPDYKSKQFKDND